MTNNQQIKRNIIIAIDGPAASGKSTLAKSIAEKMKVLYINTGLMYRAITYKCLQAGISMDSDSSQILEIINHTKFEVNDSQIYVDGIDFSSKASSVEVESNVSVYAKLPVVRESLVARQREIAGVCSVVMDGRDIGTVVFPYADVKIFLIASVEARAKRRFDELLSKYPNNKISLEEIRNEICMRDKVDSERLLSPLLKANDAIEVDTSMLSISEMVDKVFEIILSNIHKQ